MFTPSQNDVRTFFCDAYQKHHSGTAVLNPMETLAVEWIAEHPEYHADLSDHSTALTAVYDVDTGRANPFLHLSMHLSISEQVSIDQPRGIRQAVELLASKLGSLHQAHHEVMECLGEMVWNSQRSGLPPDGAAYIDAIRKRAIRFNLNRPGCRGDFAV